jgi:hypothetical protein
MATKKRSKGGRASATRAKTTARPRATTKAKATPRKKATARAATTAKPTAKAKPAARAKAAPKRAAAPKRPAAKPVRNAGAENSEVVTLKARFQRERNGLEKRLTEAVREIGLLRHHELRAMQFERQVAERDATIGRLQMQLSELERRPAEPIYVREVQQTLALITPAHEIEASASELDEFEDDRLGDDGDLVSDED